MYRAPRGHRPFEALLTGLGLVLMISSAFAQDAAVGPIPDFEPVAGVTLHRRGAELAPALWAALQHELGSGAFLDTADPCGRDGGVDCLHWPSDGMMLWARDYHPLVVRRADGGLKFVAPLSINPNRTRYPGLAQSRGGHPVSELRQQAEAAGDLPVIERLPLLHEGGNLVADGHHIFVTDRLIADNGLPPRNPDIAGDGFEVRAPYDVVRLFAQAVERPATDIVVLPSMPGDAAQHVDMFLMALEPDVLLVPQVPPEVQQAPRPVWRPS